jgi:hypothetical protein
MSRCVYAAVALSLTSFAFGQDTPALTLAPRPLPNLIKDASFEEPSVTKRLSAKENGDPSKVDESKTSWARLRVFQDDKEGEGKFTVGLDNEFARTGKQCVFVDFDKVTGISRRAYLMTQLLPIKPASAYRIGIWGRTDSKRPLTLDQRLAFMKVEVEYFTPDTESQSGDTDNRTLLIPGNSKRIFFVSNKWTEYRTMIRTPRDAGWMKVTFRWETSREKGTTDGTIYFDDASIAEVPGDGSLIPVDESDAAKPILDEDEAGAAEAPAAPANPPAPSVPPKKP